MSNTNESTAQAASETTETGDQGKPTQDAGKTYTSADIERIMQGRLAKYADYDDIVAERDALKSATASDQEKAIEAAKSEGRNEVVAAFSQRLIESEARAAAAELRFHDPKDAHLFIDAKALVGKDGQVDGDALRAAIEKVAQDKPHLVKQDERSVSHRDVGIGTTGRVPEPGPGVARLEAAYASKK